MDYWFRMEVEGWENLPEPPALLIGIHSGAPFVWDAWTLGVQWLRRFGSERPLHGTAHDALMATPVLRSYFRRMGVLPAAPDSISAALAAGRDVGLWPGGERPSPTRPSTDQLSGSMRPTTGPCETAGRPSSVSAAWINSSQACLPAPIHSGSAGGSSEGAIRPRLGSGPCVV
jgi:Acyltransferase